MVNLLPSPPQSDDLTTDINPKVGTVGWHKFPHIPHSINYMYMQSQKNRKGPVRSLPLSFNSLGHEPGDNTDRKIIKNKFIKGSVL